MLSRLSPEVRQYLAITGNYWAFTLTDGALRMLVVLHFHQLGYAPLQVALLFVFYEIFGVVTNLVGGWLGARIGLNRTMHMGLALQILALLMLTLPAALLAVPWVMAAQALSGIAKDLNKMSAKSSIKLLVPDGQQGALYKWVAALTGSKNALKGIGFFLGGALLSTIGFTTAVAGMAGALLLVWLLSLTLLRRDLGKAKTQPKWIEGGYAGSAAAVGDKHMLIVDRDNRLLFETWNTRCLPAGSSSCAWRAGSGAVFPLDSNLRRPEGWTSADAAGLAVLPGLVRFDEAFASDPIRHAFRFTVRATNGYVFPASHSAGSASGALPMGARLRLKASKDISGYPDAVRRIFQAMKTYGLILADNGTDMYVSGTYDTRWDNDVLNPSFARLTAGDFEVVQLGWTPSSSGTDPCATPLGSGCSRWWLPSSAHKQGAGGAFYTTDLTLANTGISDLTFVLKFLGNGADGSAGAEQKFSLAAGRSVTYADVLSSVFGLTDAFGALEIRSASSSLAAISQSWTPGYGGTFGQSVPVTAENELIRSGAPRSILAVREDASFRTNLFVANATSGALAVVVALLAESGAQLGSGSYTVPPLGMVQVSHVVRDVGVEANVAGARLVLSTATPGGAFAAYAAVIDAGTNDPRTLLPR